MLKYVCLALLISYASAGVVDTSPCAGGGGEGFVEATIDGCTGSGTCVVQKDTPTQITVTFVPKSTVTGGKYLITALYLGLNIEITNVDLCKGASCPIAGGEAIQHSHVMTLPTSVPSITATTSLRIQDHTGATVLCRSIEVQIK